MNRAQYEKILRNEYKKIYYRMVIDYIRLMASGSPYKYDALLAIKNISNYMGVRLGIIQKVMDSYMNDEYKNANVKEGSSIDRQFDEAGITIKKTGFRPAGVNPILVEKYRVQRMQFKSFINDMKSDFINITVMNSLLNRTDNKGVGFEIGRRIRDEIRNIGVNNIQKSLLGQKGFNPREKAIFHDLQKLAQKGKIRVGQLEGRNVREIKNFANIDKPGKFYFKLRTKTGKLRWYNARDYSNLVASTTKNEAIAKGKIDAAMSRGSYLVIYNYYGEAYSKIGDPCWKIDGQIFSLKRNYVASNGKIYPYLRDAFPGKYLSMHPRDRHTFSGIIDDHEILKEYDKKASRNKYGLKPKAA